MNEESTAGDSPRQQDGNTYQLPCVKCGELIEFGEGYLGAIISCPICRKKTILNPTIAEDLAPSEVTHDRPPVMLPSHGFNDPKMLVFLLAVTALIILWRLLPITLPQILKSWMWLGFMILIFEIPLGFIAHRYLNYRPLSYMSTPSLVFDYAKQWDYAVIYGGLGKLAIYGWLIWMDGGKTFLILIIAKYVVFGVFRIISTVLNPPEYAMLGYFLLIGPCSMLIGMSACLFWKYH